MGAIAAALDVLVLLLVVKLGRWPSFVGAMAGVVAGGTFAFVANRTVAFAGARGALGARLAKLVLSTGAAMAVHAALVYALADRLGLPVLAARLAADVAVFSVGQLPVLRDLVFPRAATRTGLPPAPSPAAADPAARPPG